MPIDITMPALSPTMETGTLAKWLVKEGDKVAPGDVIAEIETDKATMEVEAIDEGVVAKIVVAAGTEDVPVGQLIAVLSEEGEDVSAPKTGKTEPKAAAPAPKAEEKPQPAEPVKAETPKLASAGPAADVGDRVKASPLARRIAEAKGIDLSGVEGSGPGGRVVKADLDVGKPAAAAPAPKAAAPAPIAAPSAFETEIPHEAIKLSNMRKTIARRLTEAKQTIPHIYLTVDIQLDALLKLRSELNTALEARGVKLSVNDLLIKAFAAALIEVPECNVSISGDQLFKYSRADVSVAVSIPNGLITPIIVGANNKSLSAITTEMKELAGRAKEGKLQPHEYQGGTASISNMGMYGIKQFEAVINPPQGMIMAIGAGEKRPFIVNDALAIATVMSATGSFDHRAIDGADGARLMQAFKRLVENPLTLLA